MGVALSYANFYNALLQNRGASIGVPSPLVIDSKHNLLQNESVGGTS